MKKLLTKAVLTAFLALAVISCKEDSTSVIELKNCFEMKENSYWLYDNYTFNFDGTTIAEDSRWYDSIAVTGKTILNGKDAFTIFRYSSKAPFRKTSREYIYSHSFTNDELFVTEGFVKAFDFMDITDFKDMKIPEYGLFKIADNKATTWELLTPALAIDSIPIPDGVITGVVNLHYSPRISIQVTRKETGTAIDPVTKKSVNTIKFELKYNYSGAIKGKSLTAGELSGQIIGSRVSYMVYAEGIGLIRAYSPKQYFDIKAVIPGLPDLIIISNQEVGDESVLRTYRN